MPFEKPKNTTQIGEGAYKRVFRSDSESPDYVWAEFKHAYTPEQAKSIYYLNNIAYLLFPKHTVRIRQAGIDNKGRTHIASEYVSPEADIIHQAIQTETIAGNGELSDESKAFDERAELMSSSEDINHFIEQYEKAGLRANFATIHTWGPQDIIFDEHGNFKFVDIDPAWEEPEEIDEESYTSNCLRFDPTKLQAAIADLEGAKQEQAQMYFDRLLELCRSVGFEV